MSVGRIIAMWTSGRHGQVEIARALGVSQFTVHRKLKEAGVLYHPAALEGRRNRHKAAAATTGNLARNRFNRTVWPDCPDHLAKDYHRLRQAGIRASEARAALERAS